MLYFSSNRPRKFDYIISLGERCTTTHQVCLHKLPLISSPFDYLITPFASLIKMIEKDFAHFPDPIMISPPAYDLSDEYCYPLIDLRYGVVYMHEFRPGDSFSDENVINKFTHKASNFMKACQSSKKILFIRTKISKDDTNDFIELMESKYPKLDWRLLVINSIPSEWRLKRVINHLLPADHIEWPGVDDSWGKILKSYFNTLDS